jgi:hypothetical protein
MTSGDHTPAEPTAQKPRRQRRGPRGALERVFLRLFATIGIVGIGIGIGAILSSDNVEGWIIGLVVAVVTIVLTWLLRSTRQLKS